MSFVNAVAHIANRERSSSRTSNVAGGYCRIRYQTHRRAARNVCAAKIDAAV
jgi:hypothetical protein